MANKSKMAFGTSEKLQDALDKKVIDNFDLLLLDGDTNPKVGWVDGKGVVRVVKNDVDLSGVEAEIATKADAEDVDALANELATKVSVDDVNAKIDTASQDTVAAAKAYTDGKVEAAISEHMVKKYEIASTPVGTLVDYRDHEIRVLCPAGTKFVKQNVGGTGNANMYYMNFKVYAPEGAVGFKEGDRGVIIDEYFDFNGDYAGTDEYGRNYSIVWLALASYDASSDSWTYFGKNSSVEKYIGWDYVVDWYNADGIVIASDCVRINLSNESCHTSTKPYYVGGMMKEIESIVDEKIAEADSAYEIVEF